MLRSPTPIIWRRRAVEPSTLSLLGWWSHGRRRTGWFPVVMAARTRPPLSSETAPTVTSTWVADAAVVAEAWRTWRAEVSYAERFASEAADL